MTEAHQGSHPTGNPSGFPVWCLCGIIHNMTWREFLQRNFDKLLLIFIVHAIITLMITTMRADPNLTAWLQNEASTAMGALIMLITGRATHAEPTATVTTTKSVTVAPEASTEAVKAE